MKFIDLIIDLITAIFKLLWDILSLLFGLGKPKPKEYKARLTRISKYLKRRFKGFELLPDRRLQLSISRMGLLVLGPSGVGKTTKILIALVMDWKYSMLVNDNSGEILKYCYSKLKSEKVKVLIWDQANPKNSVGFNPLHVCKSKSERAKLSYLQEEMAGGGKMDFWHQSAVPVKGFVYDLLATQAKKFNTLHNAYKFLELMQTGSKKLDKLVIATGDQELINTYKSILATEPKVLSNIISTALATLRPYTDPTIALTTSYNTFDLEELRKKRVALFIRNRVNDARFYGQVSSLLLSQLLGMMFKELPKEEDLDVALVLEEFSSMYLREPDIIASNARKFFGSLVCSIQHMASAEAIYGSYVAKALKSNLYTKIHFPGMPQREAEEIERLSGIYESEDPKTGQKKRESLILAQEARNPGKDKVILQFGGDISIAKLAPFYKQRRLKKYPPVDNPPTDCLLPSMELPVHPIFLNEDYEERKPKSKTTEA